MLSDHVFSLAGHSITITAHDILLAGLSVLIGLFFWTVMYFSRRHVVVVKHSSAIDQIALELSRIANAVEGISNQKADRAIAAASRRQQQSLPPPQRESSGIPYSMFGR